MAGQSAQTQGRWKAERLLAGRATAALRRPRLAGPAARQRKRIVAVLAGVGFSLCVAMAPGDEPQPMPRPLPYEANQLPASADDAPAAGPCLDRSFCRRSSAPRHIQYPATSAGAPLPPIPRQNVPTVPHNSAPIVAPAPVLPPGFLPWWQAEVTRAMPATNGLGPGCPDGPGPGGAGPFGPDSAP